MSTDKKWQTIRISRQTYEMLQELRARLLESGWVSVPGFPAKPLTPITLDAIVGAAVQAMLTAARTRRKA